MRLVSFASPFGPRLGARVDGQVIDLTGAYASYLSAQGTPQAVERAAVEVPSDATRFLEEGPAAFERAHRAVEHARRPDGPRISAPASALRLLPPVPRPPKILCLGLNYRDHAEESGQKVPTKPPLFAKFAETLIGPGDPLVIPTVSDQVDYEAELAVVIGRHGRYVPAAQALRYVAGYTVLNDVSIRDYQYHTTQWMSGKMFSRSTPVGPDLVTADEVGDPHELDIGTVVNGRMLQQSNTKNLIFKIPEVIAYISEICELEPGDIIATGTPSGVGFLRKPPIFLRAGDTMVTRIARVGEMSTPVVAAGKE